MTGALPATVTARRRSTGSCLGPLPMINVVVLEIGLALALALVAAPLALGRWRGRWLVLWAQLTADYLLRSRRRTLTSAELVTAGHPPTSSPPTSSPPTLGTDDSRVALLRLVLPELIVAHTTDHQREPLGLAGHRGTWTAVLQVDAAPLMIAAVGGTPSLPLGALAPCLEDRGVVLDAIQVIWHCYPGSAALPSSSPALRSYLEVLGPLPATARRTTWVAVRLDPRRCLAAVAERGGGVMGSHRALIGALSRVRSALESQGISTRPLDADRLLRAGISAAELSAVAGTGQQAVL